MLSGDLDEIVGGQLDLIQAKRTAQIGAHLIRSEDEMLRSTIDLLA
jgi:hypothetical protein